MATGSLPVTAAPFEAPFETPTLRFGVKGLQLNAALDAMDPNELSRMTNVVHSGGGSLTARAGQIALATGGAEIHTIGRLNDPQGGTFTRIWGIDTDLYNGQSGALALVDSGYSGNPNWMVQYRPPLSGDSWMFIADTLRMRKVRGDGLDLPIGLPAPGAEVTAVLVPQEETPVCEFDASDGSQAANWVGTPGFGFTAINAFNNLYVDNTGVAAGPVTILDAFGLDGNAVAFRGHPGATGNPFTPTGYWYMAGLARTLDLSFVGATAALDDDLMHLYMNWSHVQFITEVRIYLVCSATFDPTVLPGGADGGTTNGDFYVKSFSPNDFASAYAARTSIAAATEVSRVHAIQDDSLKAHRVQEERDSFGARLENVARIDTARSIAPQGPPANNAWSEFGVVAIPLRRGDFRRVGTTSGVDWSAVTGIVVYVSCGPQSFEVEVRLDSLLLRGGGGLDSVEPGAQQFDWRYTHYDPRTGAEGNPSPEMTASNRLDGARQGATLTPTAFGDVALRQRFYRRGGSLIGDWFFLGENDTDGAAFVDNFTDASIVAAGPLELDHYEPVSTVDEAGNTVNAQPCAAIFGPSQDLLFLCGDPYRPGDVYHCIPGEPDHWPPGNRVEVCPPGEELMAGCIYSNQPYVFSRERLYAIYPNLTADGVVSTTPTACKHGLAGRWALAVGRGGMYFVDVDGVYVSQGGEPEYLSLDLYPLFHGHAVNGYKPIDLTQRQALRLEVHDNQLWFTYEDTDAIRRTLIYSLLFKHWRMAQWGREVGVVSGEDEAGAITLVMGGRTTGTAYRHDGVSDDGLAIACQVRTGAQNFGRPREDKLFGDLILDADCQGISLTVTTYLNEESVTNLAQVISGAAGRKRYVFDPFGTAPQKARTLSADLAWSSAAVVPTLYQLGASIIPQPDLTINRVTQWDDLGDAAEKYLMGVVVECDTGNVARKIVVEYDLGGVIQTAAVLSITCNGRHKRFFSWFAVKANLVRIRPDDDCKAWILYKLDWLADKEPPRIAVWDTNFENKGDTYYTGLDLECDTFGKDKILEVFVDQTLIGTFTVNTSGRRYVHLTFGPGRGHIYRFRATDSNDGLLYWHKWWLDAEPSEQTNWNQNYTIAGTLTDKWLKGILFECDTFDQVKQVEVQLDHQTITILNVRANDRRVLHFAFPQSRGRVLRLLPVDANPGRLYSWMPIFDEEPLGLTRWETQETDHNLQGWQIPLYAYIALRCSQTVQFDLITTTTNSADAKTRTDSFFIASTNGVKQKVYVPFLALKGVFFKYLLTSPEAFWLYREESTVLIQPWGSGQAMEVHPFGNSDKDPTRDMTGSVAAASRSGGGLS